MDLIKTLTNEEKIKIYRGNLLDVKDINKSINNWIKNDNLLSYNNLLKKLAIENITLQQFATIVSKEDIDIKEINSDGWYDTYKNIIKQYHSSKNFDFYNEESIMYFLNSMIYWCKIKIEKQIYTYKNIKVSEDIINIVLNNIGTNLFNIACKTVVYEYYNQEEKSFKNYNINNFKKVEDLENFFEKYPVIAKRLTVKVTYLLATYLKSFYQIDKDFKDIQSSLDIKIGNTITNIKGNLGDTHEKGKFVIQYEFGNKIKLVYKPKKLTMSKKFYEIVAWINKKSNCEKNSIPKNYYNEEYTIEKYIEVKACENEEQVKRYYKRLGQFLGIVYQINGNDFHYENIIACTEFPYLIDLETIFTQPISFNKKDIFDYYTIIRTQNSVDSTCFLPSDKGFADENGKGIDISALSYKKQKLPYKVLSLIGDIDNPKFEYIECEIESKNNVPVFEGIKIDYENYKSYIEEGFVDISNFIINNKVEFLEQLDIFKNVSVRQLIRNTDDYAKILEYASHPKYTMSMSSLEKMFYSMWEYNFNDKRAVTSEIEDLLDDDIPLFRTITTSRNLINSRGKIIKDYFNRSSFDNVKEKVMNFDRNELNKQVDYLNISLNNSDKVSNKKLRMKNDLYKFNKVLLKNKNYMNLDIMLQNVNNILENFAIIYKDECIWQNIIDSKMKLDIGYKNGLSGIYYYLYVNNNSNVDLEKVRNVFSNNKILGLALVNNNVQTLLDILNVLSYTFDNSYSTDCLTLKSNIVKILDEKVIDNKLKLPDIIRIIKVIGRLYKENKSYELKKIIYKSKNNLEIQLMRYGLANLNYANSVSIIDLLQCIDLIKDIYPNEQFNLNLDYVNKLNNEYLEEIHTVESLGKYSNKEYRNIIKNLSLNINNNNIDYDKLKQIVLKTVNEKEIDENIIYIIDILINCYMKKEDQEIENALDEKLRELVEYYTITNSYPVNEMNYFKNLSIESGISGIGYEILRYQNRKVSSILNLI